jgi:hypothetical protein
MSDEKHRVQRLLHRSTNYLVEMVSDRGFIDLDNLAHRPSAGQDASTLKEMLG